jgi:lipopolysaccharide transport system ATP-binding protein
MPAAIEIRGLGKRYRLGERERYLALRDIFTRAVQRLRRRDDEDRVLWALRDLTLDIERGDAVGIIGRNGAGKSTLLKILARITRPTTGGAEIHGRVGSLLEVGTGFHPELTGRENIFLNGAILGMSRADIVRRFDEIVAFAEVARFLDTAVKHYSSGMYVRLAFAVAAHLEPEILLVDEVLAVGDAAFQKKCLGKMGDVAREGRTVLFVSHGMDAIRRLCKTAIWLDGGKVRRVGDARECVSQYLLEGVKEGAILSFDPPHVLGNRMPLVLHEIKLTDGEGNPATRFSARAPVRVEIRWETSEAIYMPRIGFVLQTSDGLDVLTALDASAWEQKTLLPGRWVSSTTLPGGLLNEGEYVIDVGADNPKGFDFTSSRTGPVLRFEVEDDMTLPNKYYGQEGFRDRRWPGVLLLNLPWAQEAW